MPATSGGRPDRGVEAEHNAGRTDRDDPRLVGDHVGHVLAALPAENSLGIARNRPGFPVGRGPDGRVDQLALAQPPHRDQTLRAGRDRVETHPLIGLLRQLAVG